MKKEINNPTVQSFINKYPNYYITNFDKLTYH